MLRAVPLAHEFLVSGDGDAVQWAQGRVFEVFDRRLAGLPDM
jgi:hypothetical protein